MTIRLMGRKKGMTQLFDKDGNRVSCTVLAVEPNVVAQIKTKEKDGYEALQLSEGKTKKKRVSKALAGHFSKAGIEPAKKLFEVRVEKLEDYAVGQEIGVEVFEEGQYIDVQSVSKGKGFQGVMKRHNFKGGPASHGASLFHRSGGSTGMRSSPGRCLPGQKKPGQMGNEKVTVENLQLFGVNKELNALIVKGSVPGAIGSSVLIRKAGKRK